MDDEDSITEFAACKPLPPSSSNTTINEVENLDTSRPPADYRVLSPGRDETTSSPVAAKDPATPVSAISFEPQTEPQTVLRVQGIPNFRVPQQSRQVPPGGQAPTRFADGASPGMENEQNDSCTARMVSKQLQDIESSFTTPLSPLSTLNSLGPDDSFVFDSPSKPPNPASRGPLSAASTSAESSGASKPSHDEPSLPNIARKDHTEASNQGRMANQAADFLHTHEGTSALEAFSSSPTGATTERTVLRAMSRLSSGVNEQHHMQEGPLDNADSQSRPSSPADDSLLQARNPPSPSSREKADMGIPKISVDAGRTTPAYALKSGKRPNYLRSRMASPRSSSSSTTADDVGSDVTVGTAGGLSADYALQSGGAIPAHGTSRNNSMSNAITRQISMGSMASEFREDSTGRIGLEPLEPLDECGRVTPASSDDDRLKTPKPPRQSLAEPTDTAIARHVGKVQVPESLAREYKTKTGFVTPLRKVSEVNLGASASSTRTGRNLTLKEQSSTIERLSKENFDLKLKIMFLSDRLDKLSEEGIKEMISENVELKTSVAVLQRDNKVLRRRVKELEKKLKDEDNRPGTAKSGESSGPTADDYDAHANEEELIYLRDRVDQFVTEIERLKEENLGKEAEKRRMAEMVKKLQSINESRGGEALGQDDETEVWKELHSQETARREQSDEDNRRLSDENRNLRDEVFHLKQELANTAKNPGGHPSSIHPSGMNHTTNIYNITRKSRTQSPSRPQTRMSEAETMNGAVSISSATVDELRRETEQLRHENAELRREVGAQTSMLTSRNREKERLYQEIEDLKMAARRGGPAAPSTIDSLLERSASRAGVHDRPQSCGSGITRTATLEDDTEHEELENKMSELRDKLNSVKMQNQDLQEELGNHILEYEAEADGRKQAEAVAQQLQEELEVTQTDLAALQKERDELLQENSGLDHEFSALRAEAQDEIDHLEAEAELREQEIARLNQDLAERNENQEALQEEMRRLSEDMIRFEDTQEAQLKRIKQLEGELTEANKELEDLEAKLVESNDKGQRLGIQLESTQSEIAFLREEQEGDKLRIGDLVGQCANTELALREEKERAKELDNQLQTERQQREIVANQEKEEVQQVVNSLNREISASRDEARRLRKDLSKQEIEAAEWNERLIGLENNLREALGDPDGTRSSFLRDISKLQHDLETTYRELDTNRASLNEMDRLIKQRDELLESSALESRRLAEMLAKEQQLHRNTKHQFETYQKTQQHIHGNMSTAELRIKELETAKSQDKQRLAKLETTFKEQLNERNALLLVLWTRLSSLCGTDWAHDNSLINGRALPSLESVATMLPGFSKNLLAAVKTIESIVNKFQDRVKSVERELWKEYQHLEDSLNKRTKKLDRIESAVRNGVASGTIGIAGQMSQVLLENQKQRMAKLEDAYRQLKVENATLRTANEVRARQAQDAMLEPTLERSFDGGSPSPSVPTGPTGRAAPAERDNHNHNQRERGSRQGSHGLGATRATSSGSSTHRAASHTSTMTRDTVMRDGVTRAKSRGGENDITAAQEAVNEFNTLPNSRDLMMPVGAGPFPPDAPYSPGASSDVELKWMHRLKDLETKLHAEREDRRLERSEARRKILSLEEIALQAQEREAKTERRRKMEASIAAGGTEEKGRRKRSPSGGSRA